MKPGIKIILTISILIYALAVGAQNTAEKETFDDAEYFFAQEDYKEALTSYLKLNKRSFKDNANINYKIGICYLYTNTERDKAASFLEKAVKKVSEKYVEGSFKETNSPNDAYLWLGNAYRINVQLDKAVEAYGKFITLTSNNKDKEAKADRDYAKEQIEACKKAKVAISKPNRIKINSIGKPINTITANYNPAISHNEQFIAYISQQRFYNAVMISRFEKGKWTTPDNITPEILSDGDQLPVFLSDDGRTLLLAKQDANNSDIYISKFDGKVWSPSKPLNAEINTKYWESHACLSPDGKILYFTSNRILSKGGSDIFYSTLDNNGEWGAASNIGSEINTTSNEETPFISADGNILYFSSQGHDNIGGYDIFSSTRDGSGKWSKPVALPYPINTPDDDLFFVPTQNNYIAYQSKFLKNGLGDLDVVKIEIFSKEHPFLFNIKGNLTDLLKVAKPDKFNILLKSTNGTIDTLKTESDGSFTCNKPSGIYNITFSKNDFTADSNPFTIPEDYKDDVYILTPEILGVSDKYKDFLAQKEIQTKALTAEKTSPSEKAKKETVKTISGKAATISNILFSFDDANLNKEAEEEIRIIVQIMNDNPSLILEVTGHTDSQGNSLYNKYLSEKRAKIVKRKIQEIGINSNRIKTEGKGESEPIALNENPDGTDNPEGRAFNRRVEFRIIKCENQNIEIDTIKVPEKLKVRKPN